MTITDALCRRLREDPGVVAYVAGRVYQLKLPQQPTLPAIRVQLVTEPTQYHARGPVNLWQALVQMDSYANEFDPVYPDPYDAVARVTDAVEAALSGARFTIDPIQVTACFRITRTPFYEPPEFRITRIMQEYRCWYHRRAA